MSRESCTDARTYGTGVRARCTPDTPGEVTDSSALGHCCFRN